jgi:hypothetical protein
MSKKPIPNAHLDFATRARAFANTIAQDPARFAVSQEDSDALSAAVTAFHQVMTSTQYGPRGSAEMRAIRKEARKKAETIWRELRNSIKANSRVDSVAKQILDLAPPKRGSKPLSCPQEPPFLRFVRALHEGSGATPMHELEFRAIGSIKARPEGAVRLELFIDLIGMDEPIPAHPGENHAGRPWHLRSYTRSPIVLAPPMPSVPMIMLYWARWADSTGNVGPFSKTVTSAMVGGMRRLLNPQFQAKYGPMPLVEDATEKRDVTIRVAVLEMQRAMMLPSTVIEETKRLEGPEQERRLEEAA